VNTLKAKIMLLLLVLATLTVMPIELRADGDPIPQGCGGMACPPPVAN
jgi:hypothetical protein